MQRHWTTEKTAELNQPIYFKDVLLSEWKPGYVLCWGRFCFCFHRKRKAMDIIKIDKD